MLSPKIAAERKQTHYNIHLLFRYSKLPNQCGMWLHCGNYVNLGEYWRIEGKDDALYHCLIVCRALLHSTQQIEQCLILLAITGLWESMEISGIQ